MKRTFLALFFTLSIILLGAGYLCAAAPQLVEKTVSFGTAYTDWDVFAPSLVVGDDARGMAFVARKDKKYAVVTNGKISPSYDSIAKDTPLFSPDGKRAAYIAKRGDNWHVFLDGREGEGFEAAGKPVFSPDSKRLAYVAKKGKKQLVVADEKRAGLRRHRGKIGLSDLQPRFRPFGLCGDQRQENGHGP